MVGYNNKLKQAVPGMKLGVNNEVNNLYLSLFLDGIAVFVMICSADGPINDSHRDMNPLSSCWFSLMPCLGFASLTISPLFGAL